MLFKRSDASRWLIKETLKSGNIVVMACDTIYGFVGKVPDTEEKIRSIKESGPEKPLLRLIPGVESLENAGVIMPESDILDLWPGPFTFVLAVNGGGTTAFRVPEDPSLRDFLRELGFPLYSTSVNRSGAAYLNNPAEIEAEFSHESVLIEDSGERLKQKPSTVVDLTVKPCRILRQGGGIIPDRYL